MAFGLGVDGKHYRDKIGWEPPLAECLHGVEGCLLDEIKDAMGTEEK